MRRVLPLLLALFGVAAIWGSHEIARPLATPASVPAPPWVALLGPLRPLVAELFRLRFESRRGDEGALGQLDDAWTVLALTPRRAADFVHFGWYFVFDATRLVRSATEREACVRAGFEILEKGREMQPRSARIACAQALALDQLARHSPERLKRLALPAGETPRGRALALFEEAVALAAPDDPELDFMKMERALCAEGVLGDPASPDALRERARAALQR